MAGSNGYGDYARFASLGVSWVLTTAVLLYLGYRVGSWLDARWDTAPFLMIAGLFLAVALAMASLIKEATVLLEQPTSGRRSRAASRPGPRAAEGDEGEAGAQGGPEEPDTSPQRDEAGDQHEPPR